MDNLIVIGILVVFVGTAVFYIWKEKKKGRRCIGCPSAGGCQTNGCKQTKEDCTCRIKHK